MLDKRDRNVYSRFCEMCGFSLGSEESKEVYRNTDIYESSDGEEYFDINSEIRYDSLLEAYIQQDDYRDFYLDDELSDLITYTRLTD